MQGSVSHLLKKLSKIVDDTEKMKDFSNQIREEDYDSIDSGNQSEKDQINIIERKRYLCQLQGIDEVSTS